MSWWVCILYFTIDRKVWVAIFVMFITSHLEKIKEPTKLINRIFFYGSFGKCLLDLVAIKIETPFSVVIAVGPCLLFWCKRCIRLDFRIFALKEVISALIESTSSIQSFEVRGYDTHIDWIWKYRQFSIIPQLLLKALLWQYFWYRG